MMPTHVVKALVPTAIAAVLLSQEFPLANLDTDGTLFTVVIYGVSFSDAIARISGWMSRSHIGPVLVTDDETSEKLLSVPAAPGTNLAPPVPTLSCLKRVPGLGDPGLRHTRLQVSSRCDGETRPTAHCVPS